MTETRCDPAAGFGGGNPLVSVIVPAFNAEATLAETLAAVTGQTYTGIEVIVVDDGSSDGTNAIALGFANRDARVRVISSPNKGVAAARNLGISSASGSLIAPIDADDLWHPSYLHKLVAVLTRADEPAECAFSGFRLIDDRSNIIGSSPLHRMRHIGPYRMLYRNLVGNGSGMVFRKDAWVRAGGYDSGLRDAGYEGCEDHLLQLMFCAHAPLGSVAEHLVGYRRGPGTMSRNRERMLGSDAMMRDLFLAAHPAVNPPRWLDRWISAQRDLLLAEARLSRRRFASFGTFILRAMTKDPVALAVAIAGKSRSTVRRIFVKYAPPSQHFLSIDPADGGAGIGIPGRTGLFSRLQAARLKRIASLDEEFHHAA